jgi:hypothetical protein
LALHAVRQLTSGNLLGVLFFVRAGFVYVWHD